MDERLMTAYRYGIFFAPRYGSEMWEWGSSWLGRDARTDRTVPQPALGGFEPGRLRKLTSEPRKYGFHGTLKSPFRLAQGTTRSGLQAALAEFARRQEPFRLGSLRVNRIGRFLALTPKGATERIDRLAADTMRAFEPFRGLPTEAELARRRRAGLTERQDALLRRWGYPFVMEEFRFHLTLTGALPEPDGDRLREAIDERFASVLTRPLAVECIWLFEQPCAGAPFRAVAEYALGDTARPASRAARCQETATGPR